MESKNKKILLTISILIFVFLSYYLFVYYPLADGFHFWHTSALLKAQNAGYLNPSGENSQYYILSIALSGVSNLSLEHLTMLPIMAIPFILFFVIFFKNIFSSRKKEDLYLPILILGLLYVTKFGDKGIFELGTHGVGFVLFLMVLTVLFIRHRTNKNLKEISIIIILTVFALNTISYKMELFLISFLVALQIIEVLQKKIDFSFITKYNYTTLIIIGLVYVLSFNEFFYKTAIPRVRFARDYFGGTGLDKTLSTYHVTSSDPLYKYIYTQPHAISYGNLIWAFIMIFSLFIFLMKVLMKFIKKETLLFHEKILLAMFVASLFILIIYTYMGNFEINYIVFTGFITLILFFNDELRHHKKTFYIIVIALLTINAGQNFVGNTSGYYDGFRDNNNFEYINTPSSWYVEHIANRTTSFTVSDTFTVGAVSLNNYEKGLKATNINNFQKSDLNLILNGELGEVRQGSGFFPVYIINYKIPRIQSRGWSSTRSFDLYRENINENMLLNSIYSSGDINIFSINK